MAIEKSSNRNHMTFEASVTGATQADGEQELDISGGQTLRNWQGHFELSSIPTSGTAKIYGIPVGGTENGKIELKEATLTGGAVLVFWEGLFEALFVAPQNLDAGVVYDFIVSAA